MFPQRGQACGTGANGLRDWVETILRKHYGHLDWDMSKASFTLSESELPSEFFSYIFNMNIKLDSLSTHLEGMSLLSQYTVEEEHGILTLCNAVFATSFSI